MSAKKTDTSATPGYIDTDGEKAAAIAAPYVLKRGEIISGHKNHKGDLYPSLTFAAAVELNGKKGVEAVSVLFADKDRVHSLRVLGPDGSNFVLPIMEETTPRMEGPGVKAPITRPIGVASVDSIRDSSEKSNNKVDETIKRSRREGSRTDRELLLEAAEKKGADKAVKKYAEAVRAEERLEQKLEKQEQRLAELKEQSAGKPTVEQALDRAEKTEAAEKEAEAELERRKHEAHL